MPIFPNRSKWIHFFAVLFMVSSGSIFAQTSGGDIGRFLDRAAQKIAFYSDLKNWKASAVTTITKMDKTWKPESVTVVTKNVKVTNGEREEEILKAEETKKGKTTDVTLKYAQEAREEREKEKKRRAEEKDQNKRGEGRGQSMTMTLDEMLPFSEKKRAEFDFRLMENGVLDGRPVAVLDAAAKVKDEKNWEGRFLFDPATHDLYQVEIKPSKNPKMVKELEMRLTFEILDGRYLAVKSSRFKINGGIFIKHIRQLIEEEYSGYEVLDK